MAIHRRSNWKQRLQMSFHLRETLFSLFEGNISSELMEGFMDELKSLQHST